jgi:signal transduction histidine kinase
VKEVSTKPFQMFWKELEKRGASPREICAKAGLSYEAMLDPKGRIDWAEMCRLQKEMTPYFPDDDWVEMGRRHMRNPGMKFAFLVARLAMSPMDFYRWLNTPKNGVGNQMFTCITPSHRDLGPNEFLLDLTLPDGYEVCPSFHLVSKGNMEEMPVLLGYPRSKITFEELPNGARFHVVVAQGNAPLLKRIWRLLSRPFLRRDAAKELKAAHETLIERFHELESAQMKLDRQATQLRTAHSINQLVQRDTAVDEMLETVARAMVEEAGFTWAEVKLATLDNRASHGTHSGAAVLHRVLEGRAGARVGELLVTATTGSDSAEREGLLDFVVPSLALALENVVYRGGLETMVEQRTAELKDAQAARERFFGNISHEIRTPLTIVMLAVRDIERRAAAVLDPRAKLALGSINVSASKLLKLVDELLLLAAGQVDKLVLAPEPTNLHSMVAQLVAAWTPATEEAFLTLTSSTVPMTATVDPVAIERVLTNLVSNAVKYTPKGGAIEIQLAQDADGIRMSVLDNGKGISEDLMGRLFGRFERADGDDRKISGTGIGLSLVKQLAELHGGSVSAQRRATGGTEMTVRLPASLIVEPKKTGKIPLKLVEHVKPAATQQRAITAPTDVAKGTILLAEDDVRLAEMIADVLGEEYIVRIANDGAAALELAKQHHPELLITDVDMPIMDGIELAKRFREVSNDRLSPIIILSAMKDLGTRVAGLDAGAVDYVTKPFDPAELMARVRSQFRQREMAVRLQRAESLSTLGVLTSGLAHELRNPANGVINAIEPLKELLPADLGDGGDIIRELLDVAAQSAEQIKTISRQLLGFRDQETKLDLRPTDVSTVVSRALGLNKHTLEGVEVRCTVDRVMVNAAPPLLAQVFSNLFENAAHAAGKGGWLEITSQIDAGMLSIVVTDSGPGVPVPMRSKIFEPFFTTKKQGVGTGLGLPVSREVAIKHGGTLEVQDRGSGSAFVVRLPLVTGRDSVLSTASEPVVARR